MFYAFSPIVFVVGLFVAVFSIAFFVLVVVLCGCVMSVWFKCDWCLAMFRRRCLLPSFVCRCFGYVFDVSLNRVCVPLLFVVFVLFYFCVLLCMDVFMFCLIVFVLGYVSSCLYCFLFVVCCFVWVFCWLDNRG